MSFFEVNFVTPEVCRAAHRILMLLSRLDVPLTIAGYDDSYLDDSCYSLFSGSYYKIHLILYHNFTSYYFYDVLLYYLMLYDSILYYTIL